MHTSLKIFENLENCSLLCVNYVFLYIFKNKHYLRAILHTNEHEIL